MFSLYILPFFSSSPSFVFLPFLSLSLLFPGEKFFQIKKSSEWGRRMKDNDIISDHFLDSCHEHNIFSKLLLFLIFSPHSFFLSSFSSPFCHEQFDSPFHFLMFLSLCPLHSSHCLEVFLFFFLFFFLLFFFALYPRRERTPTQDVPK